MDTSRHISLVFGFLNERAEYAVLRNYQGLPDDNSSRDIDIVISKRCFREIKRELVECLCQEGWRIVTYLNSDRLITFVCAKNVGNETEIVQWDFFVNTSVWGVELMGAEEFLEHRVWNGFLWHVDVVGEFLDKYLYNRAVGCSYPVKYENIRLQITDNSQQDSLCSLVLSPTDDTDNTDLNSSTLIRSLAAQEVARQIYTDFNAGEPTVLSRRAKNASASSVSSVREKESSVGDKSNSDAKKSVEIQRALLTKSNSESLNPNGKKSFKSVESVGEKNNSEGVKSVDRRPLNRRPLSLWR